MQVYNRVVVALQWDHAEAEAKGNVNVELCRDAYGPCLRIDGRYEITADLFHLAPGNGEPDPFVQYLLFTHDADEPLHIRQWSDGHVEVIIPRSASDQIKVTYE